MITKEYAKDGKSCKVTFELPGDVDAKNVHIVGEFNDWDEDANPMTRQDDGSFTISLELETGRQYRFRYLLDAVRWENDWHADSYIPNPFSSDDSIVDLSMPD
ncbi:MAG: glycoside hydrolase [Chloroflexi bacterium]|nr:MAG: glycoside hydrolase [Phototrophicales bacterium]RMF81469.1 MAG: glycoside hydrolase [Chloroflexota bacterium]